MAFKLKPPIVETFHLERTDMEFQEVTNEDVVQHTTITVRQASQAQHERRSDLFSKMTSRMGGDADVVEVISRFSYPELMRIEVFLTLQDCNIEDEDGSPLFKFERGIITEKDFNRAWGKLPPLVANEIHEKVLKLNPTWGKLGEA